VEFFPKLPCNTTRLTISHHLTVDLRHDEQSRFRLGPDALLLQLPFHPHRRPVQALDPAGSLRERLDERTGIVTSRLPDGSHAGGIVVQTSNQLNRGMPARPGASRMCTN